MPSKKKAARRPTTARRRKSKADAPKASAKAKAGAKKSRGKAKAGARKAKRAPTRKRAPATVAKGQRAKTAARPTGPLVLDEVLEDPLLDVSTILRVKDGVARSQRDVDEDELKQFPDPSLVIDVVTIEPRRDDEPTEKNHLPELFAAEAQRQKQRAAEHKAAGESDRHNGSLFGSLGSTAPDRDGEEE